MQYNMIRVEYKRELAQFLCFINDLHKTEMKNIQGVWKTAPFWFNYLRLEYIIRSNK